MVRPIKRRRVASLPEVTYFKPAGVPLRALEDVSLTVEEAEAIRLKDLEGLDQRECAEQMRISRPTFHRILQSARGKVADTLLNGKALRIEGGNFALDSQAFLCIDGNHRWRVGFDQLAVGGSLTCPRCHSASVVAVHPGTPWEGPGWRRRRGARRGLPRRALSEGAGPQVPSGANEAGAEEAPGRCESSGRVDSSGKEDLD